MATRAHTVPKFFLGGFVAPDSTTGDEPFVWIGMIASGEVKRRSPKNISTVSGLYDGAGGLSDSNSSKTIEAHLASIESAAASAVRQFVTKAPGSNPNPHPAIWRFLAWQAARTPGWMEVVQQAVDSWHPDDQVEVVGPPPEGFDQMTNRQRDQWLEHPESGERRRVSGFDELASMRRLGWKWVLSRDDQLELMHLQAWYFQVRHFPRLSWVRLDAPADECFITSDRAVTWLADGLANSPPSALRSPTVQLVAPLTSCTALLGRNEIRMTQATPREVNRLVACTASKWIVGSNRAAIEQALIDRSIALRDDGT